MKIAKWVRPVFVIAGVSSGVVSLLFLFEPMPLFITLDVVPPNHIGYIQFPALLMVVLSVMYLVIAKNPVRNRNLILYGALFKLSFCAVIFPYWFMGDISLMWGAMAYVDLAFFVAFLAAYKNTKR